MRTVKCIAYNAHLCMSQVAKGTPLICCADCPYNAECEQKCNNSPQKCRMAMVTTDTVPVPERKPVKEKKGTRISHFRKVEKLHPETMEVLATYGNVTIAAVQNKMSPSNIYGAIENNRIGGKYYWRYKEEEEK